MANDYKQLVNQASHALTGRNWEELNKISNTLISFYPDKAEGYAIQGQLAKMSARPNIAVSAFSRALQLDPSRYDIAMELAEQLVTIKDNGQALTLLDRYQEYLSNSPKYLNSAATSLVGIGLVERAIPLYKRALSLQPSISLFKSNLASALVYAGEIKEAEQLYTELLVDNPHHQRNHYQLSRMATATSMDHINAMKASLANNKQPDSNNIFMYYALGKELEDLQQWDEAFHFYKKGGDAATYASNYELNEDLKLINTIKETCSIEWLRETAPSPNTDNPKPIFLLGLPRTGSTLLDRMLSRHSEIQSLGETQFLPLAIRSNSGVKDHRQLTPQMVVGAAKKDPKSIQLDYLRNNKYRIEDQTYFIEKLPFNSLFIGLISKAFPNSKIIITERAPMDSCFSMYKQIFTWAYKYSYNLENLGKYYIQFDKLMSYWKEHLPEQIHTVSYESLVTKPEIVLSDTLNFLELPFDEACLEPEKNKKASMTASSVQVREKVHSSSVGKWKNFEPHLQPLIEILYDNIRDSFL